MKRFILGLGMTCVLSTSAYASTVKVIAVSNCGDLQSYVDCVNSEELDKYISDIISSQESTASCVKPTEVTTLKPTATEQTTEQTTKTEYTTVVTEYTTEQTTQAVNKSESTTVAAEQTTKPDITYTTTVNTTVAVTEVTTEATTEATTSATVNDSDYAARVLELVNSYRAENGVKALTLNTALSAVAQTKAEDMKNNSYFSHTSPTYGTPFEMMRNAGITYSTAGENIAKGQKTPEAVVNAWINSEGHRANILNSSFTQMGLGYTPDGTVYWCQMFIG